MTSDLNTVVVTPREYEAAMQLLRDGADSETIGRRMGLKASTVDFYLKAVLRKTGTHSRVSLVVALGKGWIVLRGVNRSEPLK